MHKKSTPSPVRQSGVTMVETLVGVVIFGLLLAITFVVLQGIRESTKVERTFKAIYSLKEEIKKVNRSHGSYTKGRMMPLLFASNAFPEDLRIDYDKRTVITPMGHPLDVTGHGGVFSIDLYSMTPEECYDFISMIADGHFLMLGNHSDDFEALQVAETVYTDEKPLTPDMVTDACTQRYSIDVIMAFR